MTQHARQIVLAVSLYIALSQLLQGQGNNNPTGVTGEYNGSIMTAGGYDPYTGNAKRMVDDLTVTGSVGAYPLKWTRTLNTRGGDGGILGGGGTWSHSYQWGLSLFDNPNDGPDGHIHYPDGRVVDLVQVEEHQYVHVQITGVEQTDRVQWVPPGEDYDLLLKDGGKVTFRRLGGPLLARTIVDPYGQTTNLQYEPGTTRLSTITEPGGRYLKVNYYTESFYIHWPVEGWHYTTLISSVQAFASSQHLTPTETVTYHYERHGVGQSEMVYWNLQTVDYDDNSHAFYTYKPANFATAPNPLVSGRVATCRDKRYAGAMSNIAYVYTTDDNPRAPVGQIKSENTVVFQAGQPAAGQPVSSIAYPNENYTPQNPDYYKRWETRPAGTTTATRVFQYGPLAELTSYTDFLPAPNTNTTYISYENLLSGGNYRKVIKDARNLFTRTEKEPIADAVTAVIHHDGSSVRYHYTDPANPYYVDSKIDERDKETTYTRDLNTHVILRIDYPDDGWEDFTYNNFGQVLLHTMTSGGVEEFVYDNRGLKTHHYPPWTPSNPDRIPTRYFYFGGPSGPGEGIQALERPDLMDRLRRVIDARGNSTWFEYNMRGQVTRVTHHGGSYKLSSYNDDGTLQWTEDELRHRTTFLYDEYKRVTTVTNHLGEITTTGYAPANSFSPLSHTTSSVYWLKTDLLKETRYDYDRNFRRTLMIQAPGTGDTATTEFHYDAVGNVAWTRDPRQYRTDFEYDNRNRLWKTTVTIDGNPEITEIKYDAAGNKERETRPDGVFRSWKYDEMNRLEYAFDWRTNEDPRADQTTHYSRDHAGNVESITDTKQAIYGFGYDKLNRKTTASYPTASPGPSPTETWLYDPAGNIFEYKNPTGQVRHFHHDNRNRQDDSWWTGSGLIGPRTTTGYDDASRVTSITTKNATTNNVETVVAFGYDDANRKIWEDQTLAGEATHRVNAPTDRDGRRTSLQIIDSPGQGGGVLSTSEEMSGSGSYSISFEYTERNQLKRINGGPGENWAFTYLYDANGNMASRQVDYDGGTNITQCPDYGGDHGYDARNRPKRWEQIGPNGLHAFSHYRYDRANREEATWRDEDNGRGELYEYEVTDQLKKASYNISISSSPSPSPTPPNATPTPPNATPTPSQQAAMPTFNPAGGNYAPWNTIPITITTTTVGAQIKWTNDGIDPGPNHGTVIPNSSGTIYSGYREDFTLKAIAFKPGMADSTVMEDYYYWDTGGLLSTGGRTVTYSYSPDKLNRSSVTETVDGITTTKSYTPNALNQYTAVGGTSYSYDDNFNLTGTGAFFGTYNSANQLVTASNSGATASFVYDGLGRCVKRTIGSEAIIFVFDGWKPIGEFYGGNNFLAWNVYGPGADEILLRQKNKYGYTLFLPDRHGNVAFLVGDDGLLRESYKYDAFGRPTIIGAGGEAVSSTWYSHGFLFQGREYISELAIYDFRNRFYRPELGRFLQIDPKGFDAGDMNLFRYCGDDPIDRSDPLGLDDLIHLTPQEQKLLRQARMNTDTPGHIYIKELRRNVTLTKMQAIIRSPNQPSRLSQVSDGEVIKEVGAGGTYHWLQKERLALQLARGETVPIVTHKHWDKAQASGEPAFSANLDRTLARKGTIVERSDESEPGVYKRLVPQRNGTIKEENYNHPIRDKTTSDNNPSRDSSNLTAAQLDSINGLRLELAFLGGQESVNIAPGQP